MKRWHSVLLIGLVVVLAGLVVWLASSVTGCYTQDDLGAAYQDGYTAGYDNGYEAGYNKGCEDGIDGEHGNMEDVLPPGAIPWYEAKQHIGEWKLVWGVVVGASYRPDISGQPTWLNVGEDYPSQNRFVVIIWGEDRGNFPQAPEEYYLGETICVTGLITEYQGIPQIRVRLSSEIEVYVELGSETEIQG